MGKIVKKIVNKRASAYTHKLIMPENFIFKQVLAFTSNVICKIYGLIC